MGYKGSAQEFNEKFFNEFDDIKWFDKKGTFKIDDQRNALITISDGGYCDHFSGYRVEIVSKTSGKIDSHFFGFNDYLKTRIDARKDYNGSFEIIGYCGWDWYIAKPSENEIFRMAQKIFEYIETWE